MADLNITPIDTGFPASFEGTLEEFKDEIFESMGFEIDSEDLILGQIGGSEPADNSGGEVWLNNGAWWYWTGSFFEPVVIQLGNETFQATFNTSSLSANRTLNFPDKDGTIALTSDLNDGRDTEDSSSTDIDWSLSNTFQRTLTADTTFDMINSLSGQEIFIAVITASGDWAPTFNGVSWEGGVVPTPTVSPATDLYIFKNVAGAIYGDAKLDMS